jgi:hypothetical protein
MAVLLESCPCPVCGRSHDFGLAGAWAMWWSGEDYAFTCPTTGGRGQLWHPATPGEPVNRCPASAVMLWRR